MHQVRLHAGVPEQGERAVFCPDCMQAGEPGTVQQVFAPSCIRKWYVWLPSSYTGFCLGMQSVFDPSSLMCAAV